MFSINSKLSTVTCSCHQVENQLEKKLEEALKLLCNEDVVCEVAAVEAVCENILSEAEEDFNSISYYRKKRSAAQTDVLTYFWPREDHQTGQWIYWKRGDSTVTAAMPRIRRDTLMNEFDDFENTERHKRQFGFSLDHLFGSNQATTVSPPHSHNRAEDDYLGVLIDIISRSMVSDIGFVRFGSFLSSLESQNGKYTTDDFIAAFSREFGEEKAAALRELAAKKLANMKIAGLTMNDSAQNQTERIHDSTMFSINGSDSDQHYVFTRTSETQEHVWTLHNAGPTAAENLIPVMQASSRAGSFDVGSVSYDYDASHSSEDGHGYSKKNLKLYFRVEGELAAYFTETIRCKVVEKYCACIIW